MLEDFEKFDSTPFLSPGCHDYEKRERTLSCGALCARQTCWNGPRASCMWSENDLKKRKPPRSFHPIEVLIRNKVKNMKQLLQKQAWCRCDEILALVEHAELLLSKQCAIVCACMLNKQITAVQNNNHLKRTHCFWIQLVSVLGQNFIHTGLV